MKKCVQQKTAELKAVFDHRKQKHSCSGRRAVFLTSNSELHLSKWTPGKYFVIHGKTFKQARKGMLEGSARIAARRVCTIYEKWKQGPWTGNGDRNRVHYWWICSHAYELLRQG